MEILFSTKNLFIFLFLVILLFGVAIGHFWGIYRNNLKPEILYISQEEILQFEKSRIGLVQSNKNKALFFGKLNEAMRLIEDIAKSYASDDKIVIFSIGKIYGPSVYSISNEVYLSIINQLKTKEE